MDIFGRKTEQLEKELREKNEVINILRNEMSDGRVELEKYRQEESQRKKFREMLKENVPEEQNARKNYFTDITMFYNKYFKDKLTHMISMQKNEIIIFGKTEKEYDTYRANINCFYLLDDWFSHAEREYLSDLEEARQKVEEDLASVDHITRKYKQ